MDYSNFPRVSLILYKAQGLGPAPVLPPYKFSSPDFKRPVARVSAYVGVLRLKVMEVHAA